MVFACDFVMGFGGFLGLIVASFFGELRIVLLAFMVGMELWFCHRCTHKMHKL